MSFSPSAYPTSKEDRYTILLEQCSALIDGIRHPIVNMANIAALLWQGLPEINWCGFYLMDGGLLLLGPFCGLPACTMIPLNRGVCGAAARNDAVQRVMNVHEFPGHIACDSASNSEIVLPIHHEGRVIGVLDIDSPVLNRFDEIDESFLRKLISLLAVECSFAHTAYSLE